MISGINHGANLGDDIMYSGTVAAAREASAHGVPSLAVSQAYDEKPIRFKEGAAYARDLIAALLHNGLSGEICLNVNFPIRKIKGTKITGRAVRNTRLTSMLWTTGPITMRFRSALGIFRKLN